jgi:hypothetical protein
MVLLLTAVRPASKTILSTVEHVKQQRHLLQMPPLLVSMEPAHWAPATQGGYVMLDLSIHAATQSRQQNHTPVHHTPST